MVGLPFRLGIDLMAHANMQTKLHIVKRVYRLWAVWGGKRIIEKRQAEFEIGERFVFLVPLPLPLLWSAPKNALNLSRNRTQQNRTPLWYYGATTGCHI